MKIFVSWSGELSHKVALFLKEWFPNVIQTVELYVSSEDIDKGARWFAEVGSELENVQFGIVCLTHENINAPWVLFESGAISKTVSQSRVAPLLIDLSPAELKGTLVQFQATSITEPDIRKLARTVNALSEITLKDTQLDRVFNKWWPELEQFLAQVASTITQEESRKRQRNDRELLEEILLHVRAIARSPQRSALVSKSKGKIQFEYVPVFDLLKRALEEKGKPLLAVALEGAQKVSISENELRVEFAPEAKHLKDALARMDNLRTLRDVCSQVVGRSMGVSVTTVKEASEISEEAGAQRLQDDYEGAFD